MTTPQKNNARSLTRKRTAAAAILAVTLAAVIVYANPADRNCMSFEAPLAGSIITAPSCTISLAVDCQNISRVDLRVLYIPDDGTQPVLGNLVSITRPPYKLLWDISQLPNQLYGGVVITADAQTADGSQISARQEGIFLAHNPVNRERVPMPYALDITRAAENDPDAQAAERAFELADAQKSAQSVAVWNESGVVVMANVRDPRFYINRPGRDMAAMGLEVLIDPARKRSPHPTSETMRIFVPLSGAPQTVRYFPKFENGIFTLDTIAVPVDYAHSVSLGEFRGYTIQVTIPRRAFGRSIPDTISMNLALRVLDDYGLLQKIPLYGANELEMHSPFVWHDYYKLPKPLIMNAALRWIIFPIAGFLTTLVIYILYIRFRGAEKLTTFERSEEEKAAFERVAAVVAKELVRPNLTIDDISAKCGIPPQPLNALLKRSTGYTFVTYLQFCRTEVAKERLLASKATEKQVADQCGFANAIDMENCFIKFHKMTPYRYRTRA